MKILALMLFFATSLLAQFGSSPIQFVSTSPVGNACGSAYLPLQYVTSTGEIAACISGTWTAVGGGGGGGGATNFAQLTDCKVTVAGAVATIAAPCRVRSGSQIFSLGTSATATLSGTSASGTVYFGWTPGENLPYASESTSATLTCNAFCTTTTNATFTTGSIKLASAAFTSNSFGSVTEYRAGFQADPLDTGDSAVVLTEDGTTGRKSISLDTTNIVLTKATAQSGSILQCVSTGGNTASCNMTPTLTGYTTGMVVELTCNTTAITGAATLNINGLGSKNIKKSDGTTNPSTGDCAIGQQVPLRYDGTSFRLPASGGGGASSPLTTKGDVWTYSTVDARLGVGSNGQALAADSSQTTGNKWSYVKARDLIPPCSENPQQTVFYPGAGWSAPSTSAATNGCVRLGGDSGTLSPGTSGVSYASGTASYLVYMWRSPIEWVPANGLTIKMAAITSLTAGTFKLSVSALCVPAGTNMFGYTPTWGTQITSSVPAGAVNSDELLFRVDLSAANMGSCTAGRSVWLLIGPPDGTNPAALYMYGAELVYDRTAY